MHLWFPFSPLPLYTLPNEPLDGGEGWTCDGSHSLSLALKRGGDRTGPLFLGSSNLTTSATSTSSLSPCRVCVCVRARVCFPVHRDNALYDHWIQGSTVGFAWTVDSDQQYFNQALPPYLSDYGEKTTSKQKKDCQLSQRDPGLKVSMCFHLCIGEKKKSPCRLLLEDVEGGGWLVCAEAICAMSDQF